MLRYTKSRSLRVDVWEETDPGFLEIDLVAHCGDNALGPFISTLNTTDIATGWFEAEAVMGKGYCTKSTIIFTRSRPYKKNDNAHIEQKNFTTVRQVLGYQRFDTDEVLTLMNELYRGPLRLYINFFQPSEKCIEKKRVGSRIIKKYDIAKTPYERVMLHPKTTQKTRDTLTTLFNSLDPFLLRKEIDTLVREIQRRGRWHV
jgi:hypothetical protein